MSTSIYLQCDSHTPPISSDGEVGQHLYDLPDVRRHIKNRKLYRSMAEQDLVLDAQGDQYAGNAFRFLNAHPDCAVSICDEYGRTHPLEPDERPTTEEDVSIIPPKIDTSTGHDDDVDMTPEDAPDGYYLVRWWGEEQPVPAEKVQGQWWVIGKPSMLPAKDVLIVSRLIPEVKA